MNFERRRTLGRGMRSLVVGLCLLGLSSGVGTTQKPGQPAPVGPPDPLQMPDASNQPKEQDPFRPSGEKQAKLRNEERQKRLVSDTDKLLTLATQLHDDVAKTDKDILSLDVVRRADEIEKLAHNVKERMKG